MKITKIFECKVTFQVLEETICSFFGRAGHNDVVNIDQDKNGVLTLVIIKQ
jgi:hypothetical protein